MRSRTIFAVDLFAGAGGTSTGLVLACQQIGKRIDLTAINHWQKAIETHEANHPWAKHICQNIEAVDPRSVIPQGRLNILVASPECTHFSCAAGGRPKLDQKRASAWQILRWLELLKVDSLLVENVPEFATWGALDRKGYPIKSEKGKIFNAWLESIRSFGYTVDYRILNAADYGAATSRKRLFVLAKRGRRKTICFPEPTFSRDGAVSLSGDIKPKWKPARGIIDWSLKGESIFERKRPLSPNTIKRIIAGLKKFGGRDLQPFIILMEHGGGLHDISDPLPTITTAKGGSMALAEPFIMSQGSGGAPRSVDEPLFTNVSAGGGSIVQPFLTLNEQMNRNGPSIRDLEKPLPTITSSASIGLVEPFITDLRGGAETDNRIISVENPIGAIPASGGRYALTQSFLLPPEGIHRGNAPKSVDEPLGALTQRGGGHLVESCLLPYNGSSQAQSVDEPLPTITTKDRFGLVQPEINGQRLDIKFRMLQPTELASAMGFPSRYQFKGTKTEVVKQIGNAVVVDVAKALCLSLLSEKVSSA